MVTPTPPTPDDDQPEPRHLADKLAEARDVLGAFGPDLDLTTPPPVLVQVAVRLHWRCRRCGDEIADGLGHGHLQVDDRRARSAPPPTVIRWESVHVRCDTRAGDDLARIDVGHLATPDDLYAAGERWGAWLADTDWPILLDRVTVTPPPGPAHAIPVPDHTDVLVEKLTPPPPPPDTGNNFTGRLAVRAGAAVGLVLVAVVAGWRVL